MAELEAAVLERERASAQATHDRTLALEAVEDLERKLAARTTELEVARAAVAGIEAELAEHAGPSASSKPISRSARSGSNRPKAISRSRTPRATPSAWSSRRQSAALDALDAHAEAIEAELADARRAADNSETRRELETALRNLAGANEDLAVAREELGSLEAKRAAHDQELAHDRSELEQLQATLAAAHAETQAAREELTTVHQELTTTRRAVDETMAEVEVAERAREAITMDSADLLARAEAQATGLIERANRDAEAIRQEALRWEEGLRAEGRREQGRAAAYDAPVHPLGDESAAELVERVERLERKVAKQRRRIDRISDTPGTGDAERDADDIRRAARRDREVFRAELEGLLRRLAPLVDDDDDDDL